MSSVVVSYFYSVSSWSCGTAALHYDAGVIFIRFFLLSEGLPLQSVEKALKRSRCETSGAIIIHAIKAVTAKMTGSRERTQSRMTWTLYRE